VTDIVCVISLWTGNIIWRARLVAK